MNGEPKSDNNSNKFEENNALEHIYKGSITLKKTIIKALTPAQMWELENKEEPPQQLKNEDGDKYIPWWEALNMAPPPWVNFGPKTNEIEKPPK